MSKFLSWLFRFTLPKSLTRTPQAELVDPVTAFPVASPDSQPPLPYILGNGDREIFMPLPPAKGGRVPAHLASIIGEQSLDCMTAEEILRTLHKASITQQSKTEFDALYPLGKPVEKQPRPKPTTRKPGVPRQPPGGDVA